MKKLKALMILLLIGTFINIVLIIELDSQNIELPETLSIKKRNSFAVYTKHGYLL